MVSSALSNTDGLTLDLSNIEVEDSEESTPLHSKKKPSSVHGNAKFTGSTYLQRSIYIQIALLLLSVMYFIVAVTNALIFADGGTLFDAKRVFYIVDVAVLVIFSLEQQSRCYRKSKRILADPMWLVDTTVIFGTIIIAVISLCLPPAWYTLYLDRLVGVLRLLIVASRASHCGVLYQSLRRNRPGKQFQSNLERAIDILSHVKSNLDLSLQDRQDIEWINHILASNQIFEPILHGTQLANHDSAESKWVLSNFTPTHSALAGLAALEGGSSDRRRSQKFNDIADLKLLSSVADRIVTTSERGTFSQIIMDGMKLTVDDVEALGETLKSWECDIFALEKRTGGQPLLFVSYTIFKTQNFYELFAIPEAVVRRYFNAVEAGYRKSNPYHNNTHAADVAQAVYVFLREKDLSKQLQPQDSLAMVIAASIHDYDHPGVGNAFLIASRSEIAILYNDRSVLENHHVAAAFYLMKKPNRDILASLPKPLQLEVRETIITAVLATDMAHHFEEVGKFKAHVTDIESKADRHLYEHTLPERRLLLKMGVHSADLGNPAKVLESARIWTAKITAEFYDQGDKERALGLPVSPFMDRSAPAVAKCQVAFVSFIVQPTFENWTRLIPSLQPVIMKHVFRNLDYWKSERDKEAVTTPPPAAAPVMTASPVMSGVEAAGPDSKFTVIAEESAGDIADSVTPTATSPKTASTVAVAGALTGSNHATMAPKVKTVRTRPKLMSTSDSCMDETLETSPKSAAEGGQVRSMRELERLTQLAVPETPAAGDAVKKKRYSFSSEIKEEG